MRSLYISQTGMAENLGQSQVLPYLRGLVRRGADVTLVSFELGSVTAATRDDVAAALEKDGIRWHPLVRKMPGSLAVKVKESAFGVGVAMRAALQRAPDVVHGRSYFATAICDAVSQVRRRSKLLFDCRGMLGDEYVDAGYWTTDRVEYKLLKGYEKRLFKRSDGIVVLTSALKNWLVDTKTVGPRPVIEVVPCCVDTDKFKPSVSARLARRQELGLGEDFTILYAGSLGNWYLEPEMARFAACVRKRMDARVRFVAFTPSNSDRLRAELASAGFAAEDITIRRIPPKEMPEWLCVGDLGLSFIQSCFSKKGSSPTKVAEYLACGLVAVVNGDIGDQADLRDERDACVVLSEFSDSSFDAAAQRAIALGSIPYESRSAAALAAARRQFGLQEVGVERYARLYERLLA
jgi:glycosyltransferase involved in cell wall biosynthesis